MPNKVQQGLFAALFEKKLPFVGSGAPWLCDRIVVIQLSNGFGKDMPRFEQY